MLDQKISAVYSPMKVTFDDNSIKYTSKIFKGVKESKPFTGIRVSVTNKDYKNGDPEIIFEFDDLKSIDKFIDRFEQAKSELKKGIEQMEEERNGRKFVVPVGSLIVPPYFTNPDTDKLLKAIKYYDINKKINHRIKVDENLVIKDGYIGYLVAKYYDLKEVEVVANDGIRIQLVDGAMADMTFPSKNIRIEILEPTDFADGAWVNVITTDKSTNIQFQTSNEAVIMLRKICKVFDAKFDIHSSKDFFASRFMYDFMSWIVDYGMYGNCKYTQDL